MVVTLYYSKDCSTGTRGKRAKEMPDRDEYESLTPAQQELYDWLVDYIQRNQHSPSIRQMMQAMNLKSPAPVQSRLERLRSKGYIDWTEGRARTIRILYTAAETPGIRVLGAIAAGGVVETFTDVEEQLDLAAMFRGTDCYALRVVGDSMIQEFIADGDLVVMRRVEGDSERFVGEIVAARVEGLGTTLKRFTQKGETVVLKAANPNYDPIVVSSDRVEIQGVLTGVWRPYR